MSPLLKSLKSCAPWLFDVLGFTVVGDQYFPESFGNSIVMLQSENARLRIVSDRGQISAQLASPASQEKWWDIYLLLEAIHGVAPKPKFEVEQVVAQLRASLNELLDALGTDWPHTKRRLDQTLARRMQALTAQVTPAKKTDWMGILLRVGLFILIGYMGMILFPWVMFPLAGYFVTAALSVFAAAAVANAITVRIYERGRLADLGLGWVAGSKREFFLGAGFGFAAAVAVVIIPVALRVAHFESAPSVEHRVVSIVFVSVVLLFGAMGEEMLFHGYAFQLLIRSIGAWATILPAAVLFGLAHIGNENSSWLGVINTMLWGVLFGFAYIRTGALWLPIGLHYGWNVALPLLGTNLSGFTMGVTGYALRWTVGDLWSGGGYGPEGGLPVTAIVIVLFIAVNKAFPDRETIETLDAAQAIE